MNYVDPNTTVRALLEERASRNAELVVCRFEGGELTYAELNAQVNRFANGLLNMGIRKGDRVAVMLAHHTDHIVTFFALAKIAATLVPVNVNLKGDALEYLLRHSEPTGLIADTSYDDQLAPVLRALGAAAPHVQIWRGASGEATSSGKSTSSTSACSKEARCVDFREVCAAGSDTPPPVSVVASDVLAICYTSGTTGAPKGALITDKMYRASAVGSLMLSGVEDHETFLFWEPMYHLFGMEVLVLAVLKPLTLGMVERFSATRFWEQARHYGATHIHYVGGVPQLLMKQPESTSDRDHKVRVAWGGGCPIGMWRAFEKRFGLHMRDSFGMTETASLNIINVEGEPGALGRPLPYFEARIVDDAGVDVALGQTGELLVRGKEPGLITPGYFRNPEATASAIRDGWLHTGDYVRQDDREIFFFVGRKKDSIRRRGENISAWEVERIINSHPQVEESALIAVANEFGDEEIKAFVKPHDSAFDPAAFVQWCEGKMARFQVPRFVALVDSFPKTPTQRIMKHQLSRSITDCWDRGDR
jgi:crotonobetaine/carnitine-CoA ligase